MRAPPRRHPHVREQPPRHRQAIRNRGRRLAEAPVRMARGKPPHEPERPLRGVEPSPGPSADELSGKRLRQLEPAAQERLAVLLARRHQGALPALRRVQQRIDSSSHCLAHRPSLVRATGPPLFPRTRAHPRLDKKNAGSLVRFRTAWEFERAFSTQRVPPSTRRRPLSPCATPSLLAGPSSPKQSQSTKACPRGRHSVDWLCLGAGACPVTTDRRTASAARGSPAPSGPRPGPR